MSTNRFLVPVGVVSLAAPPDVPVVGETYFDTILGQLRSWDGSAWVGTSSDANLDAQFVNVPGDGMTGELALPDQVAAPPSVPVVVAAKGYVDQLVTVSIVPPSLPPARDGLIWTVTTWSPESVPGLGAWFDPAQDTFEDGERISTYVEHSPAHYEFTAVVGQEPIFRAGTNPYLEFVAPVWGMGGATNFNPGPDGLTLIMVGAPLTTTAPMAVVVGPGLDGYEMRFDNMMLMAAMSYSTAPTFASHTTLEGDGVTRLHVIRVDVPAQRTDLWVDDVLVTGPAPTVMRNVPEAIYLGVREGGYPYLGTISEALVYAGPVSDANLALLTDYLIAKHGSVAGR